MIGHGLLWLLLRHWHARLVIATTIIVSIVAVVIVGRSIVELFLLIMIVLMGHLVVRVSILVTSLLVAALATAV